MTSDSMTATAVYDVTSAAPAAPAFRLRRRLLLLIVALLAALGTAFSWMAYREVEHALRASGAERIEGAAQQVADLLGQSSTARIAEAKRLASDAEVQQAATAQRLVGDTTPAPAAVQAFVTRNALTTVWIYDGQGRLLGHLGKGRDARAGPEGGLPQMPPAGLGPLRAHDGQVSYHTTAPITIDASATPIGYLSIQRTLGSAQAITLIERLIGSGAALKLGNATGDLWTDLSVPVAAPPASSNRQSATYSAANGERRIGTAVPIPNTPWLVWVDVSERSVLGPATTLLRRMVPITLVLTIFGALAVYVASSRVTKPIEQVAQAAEAIAAGDYSRRVPVNRGDEIGRLAASFNVMASRVSESHEELEARVHARTEELEHARQELDQFFSMSIDLLCIAGVDGRFRRVNPAWEHVLGWTANDLTSIPYIDLVHPDDRAATLRESARLAEGTPLLSFENRYRAKDGSYRWLSWKSAPLLDRGLIYASARDITEQKRIERALHQHGAELATANRELESFSYSVSHDLRSPLRSIDGFAQALIEDYDDRLDTLGRDYLGRIRAAAQRMGTLIDDLLSLSRVTRVELVRSQVDVTALATEIAARLEEQEPTRRVEWRIAPNTTADADPRLLRVALENLLGNAWKFTGKRDAAAIEFGVATAPEGGRAFYVRDNGAGFDMAHAGKLFGAFQRLHGVTEFPGTGIGLATVQRIVRRHNGRIWADSTVNGGAAFFFTLEAA